jgi:hypothetical protein
MNKVYLNISHSNFYTADPSGRLLARIAGSNTAQVIDACPLCVM